MKKVVVTGSSRGIGRATAQLFVKMGYEVHGLDIRESSIESDRYIHHVVDVSDSDALPSIEDVSILVNNAGVQNSGRDIEINLVGIINTTRMYGLNENIESIVNIADSSATSGSEFDEYCASKGGVLSYTRWTAKQVAKYGATCNSLSFGGVDTLFNEPILDSTKHWKRIMDETPLKKWATVGECAQWIYFLTCMNKSCTGQDIIIDNGEFINHKFVWVD